MCRRCSECEGMTHHWLPDPMADDEEFLPGEYACKHCDQRGNGCDDCGGDGYLLGDESQPCEICGQEGVIPLSTDPVELATLALIEQWPEWERAASQEEAAAQDVRVYDHAMHRMIAATLRRLICPQPRNLPMSDPTPIPQRATTASEELTSERLSTLAEKNPPPKEWLEGEEEKLFEPPRSVERVDELTTKDGARVEYGQELTLYNCIGMALDGRVSHFGGHGPQIYICSPYVRELFADRKNALRNHREELAAQIRKLDEEIAEPPAKELPREIVEDIYRGMCCKPTPELTKDEPCACAAAYLVEQIEEHIQEWASSLLSERDEVEKLKQVRKILGRPCSWIERGETTRIIIHNTEARELAKILEGGE